MRAATPLTPDAVLRLVGESPGIRLGAALDACRDAGFDRADVSETFLALINADRIEHVWGATPSVRAGSSLVCEPSRV